MSHSPSDRSDRGAPSGGQHLATLSHRGRFWDVYLEVTGDPRRPDVARGVLCFVPSDLNQGEEPARTTTIIIEPSYEGALRRARGLDEHQMIGLLRSILPE